MATRHKDWWAWAFGPFMVINAIVSIWWLWFLSPSLLSATCGALIAVLTYISLRPNAPDRLWAATFAVSGASALVLRVLS
jgi:hypothetical protein